ncbi:MAG: type IV secretion system protein [Lysobacter sp.]|nr:type IV secretion system protein [Lysobacter sp.]
MFRRSKQNTPQIENTVAKAVNFEIQIADIARRNHKRAWLVACGSALMCLTMAISYVLILPLRKIESYLVLGDPYTGVTRVARLDDDEAFLRLVGNEPVLKAGVTNYIRARESFDFPSTAYRDYKIVQWMSTPSVIKSYYDLHDAGNPDEPLKVFTRERAVWIVFVSIQLRRTGDEKDMENEATVRFKRYTYEKNGGKLKHYDSKIATLEFTYDRGLHADPVQRANNPLGFLVTAYRVDNDLSAPPPPAETPKNSQQPSTAAASPAVSAAVQQPSAPQPGQTLQVPQFGAPPPGSTLPNAQPQPQYPAQPAVQPQPAMPAGQAPNQVNGVRN